MNMPPVDRVEQLPGRGPWSTKSGGQLDVLFQLPIDFLHKTFLSFGLEDTQAIPKDIRGLRAYVVSEISKGSVGAGEWHKLRSELVFALDGSAEWKCRDVYGKEKIILLKRGCGAFTPPYIMHSYTALEDNTRLLVIASTLFDADDERTHDSYSMELFRKLQAAHKNDG